jgi:hypothetical protein
MQKNNNLRKYLDKEKVLIDEIKYNVAKDPFITLEYIPEEFGLGKNLIKFKVNNYNLIPNSTIQFETIDINGTVIYNEALKYKEQTSRFVSVYIDESISNGEGKLIILLKSKIYPNGVVIDPNINNSYIHNTRYTIPIYVNKLVENKSKIVFKEDPTINITEKIILTNKIYPESQSINITNSGSVEYNLTSNSNPYIIASGFDFNSNMKDSYIVINEIYNSEPQINNYTFRSGSFKIEKIVNNNVLKLESPILIYNQNNQGIKLNKFNTVSHSIEYKTYSGSDIPKYQSFLELDINNISPATGKIDKVNVYYNNIYNSNNEYKLLSSLNVNTKNILYDRTDNNLKNEIGSISSQVKLDKYFEKEYIGIQTPNSASIVYDNDTLLDSMYFNYVNSQSDNQLNVIKLKNDYNIQFKKGSYKIQLDLVGKTDSNNSGQPNLKILLSGSIFKTNVDLNYNSLLVADIIQKENFKNYDTLEYDFDVNSDGSGSLKFVYNKGNFYISNIKIFSKYESYTNPNHTIQHIPLNLNSRFDDLKFKFEFLNKYGDKSDTIIEKILYNYTGSNSYIEGNDNHLYGKMTLSNTVDKGLAVVGDREGGYIKSNLLYQDTGSNTPSGSGLLIFDFTSGSKNEFVSNDTTIDNNAGLDLFASNGDYLIYRAYGDVAGIKLQATGIPRIKYYVGQGVSQESSGTDPGSSGHSSQLLNCGLYNFFELNYTASVLLNLISVNNYENYSFIIKNHSTGSILINIPPSASYYVSDVPVIGIDSGSFIKLSMIQTPFKRIWQQGSMLNYI